MSALIISSMVATAIAIAGWSGSRVKEQFNVTVLHVLFVLKQTNQNIDVRQGKNLNRIVLSHFHWSRTRK